MAFHTCFVYYKRRITIHNSLNFSTYLKNEIHKIYIKRYSVAYEESKSRKYYYSN